jgi:hypothetical protein
MDCELGIELYEGGNGANGLIRVPSSRTDGLAAPNPVAAANRRATTYNGASGVHSALEHAPPRPLVNRRHGRRLDGTGCFLQIYQHADRETTPVVRGLIHFLSTVKLPTRKTTARI